LLTDGPDDVVARRLNALVQPFASIDPTRNQWMPKGPDHRIEARLGKVAGLLSDAHREIVTAWWLAVRKRANTPNWDIAATVTIGGRDGLILVEAKAHDQELEVAGKSPGNTDNHGQIERAIEEADHGLNGICPGWAISCESHYQLANRFAWAWKIASLGVPVVLVYLGFLNADEMGSPFVSAAAWERVVRSYSRGIVPEGIWERSLSVGGTPLVAAIRSLNLPLDGSAGA
jgi:hypothetical protein